MLKTAEKIAKFILGHHQIRVVTHNDADGITAGSIASVALSRAGIEHEIEFVKNLEPSIIERLKNDDHELVWFTDLGSGMLDEIKGLNAVITDHHVPKYNIPEVKRSLRSDLMAFSSAINTVQAAYPLHLNPHLFNRNGELDLSGAGATYLVARAMDQDNKDLAALAIIGAVGDMQDRRTCRLEGTNRRIINDGVFTGLVEAKLDVRLYGRESRPLAVLLQYADDPLLPGLTGNYGGCEQFYQALGIPLKQKEHWRRWIDLDSEEKKRVLSALVIRLIESGLGHEAAKRLIGEVYSLPHEQPGTELHSAKEFSTLLNSCGRYDHAEVGYRVCLGDRDEWYERAKNLLQGHRANLAQTIRAVQQMGVQAMENIQYFHGEDKVLETVVGTVAGKMLGSGDIPRDKVIIAFAYTEDGSAVKVSGRATRDLVNRGIDLSYVMKNVAEKFEGVGGGHNIAAGAIIPKGSEEQFLKYADEMVGQQLQLRENRPIKEDRPVQQ